VEYFFCIALDIMERENSLGLPNIQVNILNKQNIKISSALQETPLMPLTTISTW